MAAYSAEARVLLARFGKKELKTITHARWLQVHSQQSYLKCCSQNDVLCSKPRQEPFLLPRRPFIESVDSDFNLWCASCAIKIGCVCPVHHLCLDPILYMPCHH